MPPVTGSSLAARLQVTQIEKYHFRVCFLGSQVGFPKKQTLRWRCACKKFVRISSRSTPLEDRKNQNRAEDDVEVPHSSTKTLTYSTGNSGDGVALQSCPKLGQRSWDFMPP